eukprot:scaffold270730_cov30-Tisochrysis_lutea.AAC.1
MPIEVLLCHGGYEGVEQREQRDKSIPSFAARDGGRRWPRLVGRRHGGGRGRGWRGAMQEPGLRTLLTLHLLCQARRARRG